MFRSCIPHHLPFVSLLLDCGIISFFHSVSDSENTL